MRRGTGWRKQRGDHRDMAYAAPAPVLRQLPTVADLRHSGFTPPVYDQEQTSSCTGNGVAALIQYDLAKQGVKSPPVPSRLFPYFNARQGEGTAGQDCGANIRDVIKAVAANGICFESGPDAWPFDPTKVTTQPPPSCYTAALKDRAVNYSAVAQQLNQLRGCLADGYPFTFGMNVYPEFDSDQVARTGRVPMPGPNEADEGGHCICGWGYNDADEEGGRVFLCRNSWNTTWGLNGYFLLPYEFILNPDLTSDFWTIRTVGA